MVLIISDFAKIFGCLVGLPDEITAITIVTFGTSQIDLFASRIAAVNDPIADNSIGNVVAANAIGVFLGEKDFKKLFNYLNVCFILGLGGPWLVAAIYWHLVRSPTNSI